jgi:peptidylprolyl isomerase/peptidyl-prolyl cis-trans isomerase D
MAVLSKIRERSLFLILIIAMALFAFVLSGLFDSNMFNKNVSNIGEVNGEPITREEFGQEVELFRSRSGGRSTNSQNVNNAWNSLVREKIYQAQLEKSGIVVGEKDVWDAIVNQIAAQNSPQFMNEAGLFSEEKLKEYIATLKDNSEESEAGAAAWINWLNYEKNIKESLEQNTYNELVRAGLGSTLKEGERKYYYDNTSVDVDYVYVPFNSIPDSLVAISQQDIKEYIKKHPKDFTVPESRDIKYVQFKVEATEEDEAQIREDLKTMIEDREEYSNAAKSNVTLIGFKNAVDMVQFNSDNDSDTPFDSSYYNKSQLPKILSDSLFDKNVGEVFGPYKDLGYYKLSKILDVKQIPDSVKASHILIPYVGSGSADPTVTQTEDEAKQFADSLLTVVKSDPSKFAGLARELSADQSSGQRGGDLDWFGYNTMIPVFRDYTFENKIGDMGVVKSRFGFHVIRIDDQKNRQRTIQVGTFSRKIDPSEKTENEVFERAETFASELTAGKEIDEAAKDYDVVVKPVLNLEVFDDNVAQLGSQRQIVRWTFEEGTEVGDIRRFDTDNGYIVVVLDRKNKAGLSDRGQDVRGLLMKEKKAELIKGRSTGATLEEIAKQNNTEKKVARAVSNASPVFSGSGRFVDIAGVVTGLDENVLTRDIVGQNGVAYAIVTNKTLPTELNNYSGNKKEIERSMASRSMQIYESIKENSDIVDNRSVFY